MRPVPVLPEAPGRGNVGAQATPGRAGEIPGHIRVQPDAGRAEERPAVQPGRVDASDAPRIERPDGFRRIPADAQVQGQAVAASAGDDAQRLPRAQQARGHLAHRSVAAHGDDDAGLAGPGPGRRVAGLSGFQHLVRKGRPVQITVNGGKDLSLVLAARDGIYDECNVFH